jgi:NAD(P)-dependent dehydrogenase (short-subunit alcohol dehydrogenase family)
LSRFVPVFEAVNHSSASRTQIRTATTPHPGLLPADGRPDDHVRPLLFLLSDEAAWVTGQPLAVDRGQLVRV